MTSLGISGVERKAIGAGHHRRGARVARTVPRPPEAPRDGAESRSVLAVLAVRHVAAGQRHSGPEGRGRESTDVCSVAVLGGVFHGSETEQTGAVEEGRGTRGVEVGGRGTRHGTPRAG